MVFIFLKFRLSELFKKKKKNQNNVKYMYRYVYWNLISEF